MKLAFIASPILLVIKKHLQKEIFQLQYWNLQEETYNKNQSIQEKRKKFLVDEELIWVLQIKIVKGQYESLNPRYSTDLNELIARCLQITSEQRASCSELLKMIQIRNRENLISKSSVSNSNLKLLETICLSKNYKEIRLPRPRDQTETNDSNIQQQIR